MSIHTTMVERIDAVLDTPGPKTRYGIDDEPVLNYIREQLSPAALKRREADLSDERTVDVRHLHVVAEQRLKPYPIIQSEEDTDQ